MGQGQAVALGRDTISGEQFRAFLSAREDMAEKAFRKCVAPNTNTDSDFTLSREELTCVEEYSLLLAGFSKSSFAQFSQLYEMHQRDMYEKARQEMAAHMARREMGRQRD